MKYYVTVFFRNYGFGFLCISAVLSLLMIVYFLIKGRKSAVLYSYICFQGIIFVWIFYNLLLYISYNYIYSRGFYGMPPTTFINKAFMYIVNSKLQYLAVCFEGLSWLLFCLFYTCNRVVKYKSIIIALFIPPVIFFISVLTNDYHNLFYNHGENGLFYWLHAVTTHTYLISGVVILVKYSIKQSGYARKQTILLAFAISIPLVLSFLHDLSIAIEDFVPIPGSDEVTGFSISQILQDFSSVIIGFMPNGFDVIPFGFIITMIIVAVATFRYSFLDIVPIALRKIVNSISESIIVVDNFNRIISYNTSFASNFKNYVNLMENSELSCFIDKLKYGMLSTAESGNLLDSMQSTAISPITGEIHLFDPEDRFFAVNIQPVYAKKEIVGRVITFSDISEYKRLLKELNSNNMELEAMNEQLQEHAATVEELAISRERNRFAIDMHDTLGHSMTLLIALLEVSSITCRKDPEKTHEKLQEAIKLAREGLKEVRRSVYGLSPEKLDSGNLINALKEMFADFEASGMNVEFSVDGQDVYPGPVYSDAIYRACQEALTNSLRHGNARNVAIMLKFIDDCIKLFIFDDGKGCTEIKKGLGLTGMEKRIKRLKGAIVYGSDGESGFNIRIEMPFKTKADIKHSNGGKQ